MESDRSASGRSARLLRRTGTSVPGWKRHPTSSGRTSTFLMVFQHTGDHVLILGSIGGRLHANRPAGARARPLRRHRARYSHTHWGTRPILSRRGPSLLGRCCLSWATSTSTVHLDHLGLSLSRRGLPVPRECQGASARTPCVSPNHSGWFAAWWGA